MQGDGNCSGLYFQSCVLHRNVNPLHFWEKTNKEWWFCGTKILSLCFPPLKIEGFLTTISKFLFTMRPLIEILKF